MVKQANKMTFITQKSLTIGDTNYNILLYELNTAYDVNNGQH